MGNYHDFYILNIVYCSCYIFFIALYTFKVNLRMIIPLFCSTGIYVQTMSHPGGPDYTVYSNFFDRIFEDTWASIISFTSTEFLILPFFGFIRWMDIDFRWAIFLSVFGTYLALKFFLLRSSKVSSYQFSWGVATLMASPMAPYLYGNVIRQGIASIVIVFFMTVYLNGKASGSLRYSPLFLITHRASVILAFIAGFIATTKAKRKITIAFTVSLIGLLLYYFGDVISEFLEFYRSFDDSGNVGETSAGRSMLRFSLISLPLIVWVSLGGRMPKKSVLFLALYTITIIVLYILSAKLGDRMMYFMPGIISAILIYSKNRVITGLSSLFVALPTIYLTFIGYYENIY